ncbi:tetratricopeptide repeat protein [Erythrobacter donghaensis]|uniref:tetratricopeptide repeat protein n=1 Tax=Erythrobacter donghaensis TaxID=267135 RepID=UPI000A3657A9|nr:SEL1-like repeat protein [Erythrobacter donghaensis]
MPIKPPFPLLAGCTLAILPVPLAAQQDSGPPTRAELDRQSAEAMAKSEAKVKAWFADSNVQALKARADAGDARAQVQFADRIRADIFGQIWSRDNINQSMLRYYAMAMAQNHGPAFARVGSLAESPDDSYTLKGGARELGEAFGYYEKGAELGDRDAIAGYVRIALNPNFCTFCEDKGSLTFDREKVLAAGLMTMSDTVGLYGPQRTAAYRAEKRSAADKARKFASAGRLDPGDKASHQMAAALLEGVPVPDRARETIYLEGKAVAGLRPTDKSVQWLLTPDLPEAERILLELSMRGDVLATRKLAELYLKGRNALPSVAIPKDPAKYLYHMKRAVDQGSMIAAYSAGIELLRGNNIPVDLKLGADFISTAAAAGFGPAEEMAGYVFRDGVGTEKNPEVALILFERAANNGQLKAAEEAEALYRAGYGSDQPGVRSAGALAMAAKAKSIRELSPLMADAVRRAHWDKFK